MDVVKLETLDQARALAECAYEIYGLTFHRDWLYSPERLLALNEAGHVTSLLAIEDQTVVGHLALLQPSFDVIRDGAPITDPGLREIGLTMVHPDYRGQGVQAHLGLKAFQLLTEAGAHGAFMKCVTHHTRSQRGALRFGGVPVALSLGSVPRYIVYEGEVTQPDQPISTLGFYVRFRALAPAPAWLPVGQEWVADTWRRIGLVRTPCAPMDVVGPTDLEVRWQSDRQLAQIYVLRAGDDLVERISERMRWLVGGHMAHILVYLPTDGPALAAAGPALAELGLFTAGVLPGFYKGGRDALLLQATAFANLDGRQVHAEGAEAAALRDRVLDGWTSARGRTMRLLQERRRGRVAVQLKQLA